MPKSLTATLTNCYFRGNRRTDYANGSSAWDYVMARLGKYTVKLHQRSDCYTRQRHFAGKCVESTDVSFGFVANFEEGKRLVDDLAYLLRLATMSPVEVARYQYGKSGNRPALFGPTASRTATLLPPDGDSIQIYLENAWPVYRRLKRQRKLPAMIEYLEFAVRDRVPLEIRVALVMIALEGLKATYARAAKYPVLSPPVRPGKPKGSPRPCDPTAKCPAKAPIGFKRLLSEMLKAVGQEPRSRQLNLVVGLRNQLLHTGLSPRPPQGLAEQYRQCHDLACEYLLRLLKYKGTFHGRGRGAAHQLGEP